MNPALVPAALCLGLTSNAGGLLLTDGGGDGLLHDDDEGLNTSLPTWHAPAHVRHAPSLGAPDAARLAAAPLAEDFSAPRPAPAGILVGKAGLLAPDPIEPQMTPGCYVRMPSGCPRQESWRKEDFLTWQKDSWPGWKERKFQAGTMKATCEQDRKAKLSGWCGANDVESKYIDSTAAGGASSPPVPAKVGCYVWAPGGCPRQPGFDSRAWRRGWARDSWPGWAEKGMEGHQAVEACLTERQFLLAGWCGSNLVTLWVHQAPEEPTTPGCYVNLPSGCPKQRNLFDARSYQNGWRPDIHGDSPSEASPSTCGDDRRHQINSWCGVVDARMTFVREAPPEPNEAGCHVWMPSGCPRQTRFDASRYLTSWVLDVGKEWNGVTFSDTNTKAKRMCRADRKQRIVDYCGTTDIKTLYVGSVLKPPEAPGCYLMMPSGCPRQPRFDNSKWKDQWGLDQWHGWLDHRGEGDKRGICEGRRKAINDWCGTKDAKSVLVAG